MSITTTEAPKLGKRSSCLNNLSACSTVYGTPKTRKCKGCGGAWYESTGWMGVFVWTGDGRYYAHNAVSLHTTVAQAERRIAADATGTLVTRWVMA